MPVSAYQLYKTAEMTPKIALVGILITLVFLICIQFSNSNSSSRLPQIRPDGKGTGPDRHSLQELNIKEIKPETEPLRRKRRFTEIIDKLKTKLVKS